MGPLAGIKVVEWAQWMFGPFTCSILGDLGADIIKIESIEGDPLRVNRRMEQSKEHFREDAPNFAFEAVNRNKRSLALNLREKEAQQIIYKLIAKSDIFVHNFMTSSAIKLGLDYKNLSNHNSKLIYANLTGWGTKGSWANKGAFGPLIGAKSGWALEMGEANDPPVHVMGAPEDTIAALVATVSILAALSARQSHGIGQEIETSLFGSIVTILETNIMHAQLLTGWGLDKEERTRTPNPLRNTFKCADGRWLQLCLIPPDKFWHQLCIVMQIEHLENDEKFKDLTARAENTEEITTILDNIFITKPMGEWIKLFSEADLLASPCQTPSEVVTDEQVLANDLIIDYNHPIFGPVKLPGFPYKFSATPASIEKPTPELGQHTKEIMRDLGYHDSEIDHLKERGIIRL